MAKEIKIRLFVYVLPLTFLFLGFDTSNDIQIDKIAAQLQKFRDQYTQQKVYLHTDKEIYIAPENIWIKSYLINATSFLTDTVSKEVYVDLLDFNNQHIRTIILRNVNGFGQGNIALSDTLIEGTYRLRAYSNWMRNFAEEFFFSKTIEIKNPNYENVFTRKRKIQLKQYNRLRNRSESKVSVQFMPEGGYIVEGLPCKVAFKIENEIGEGIHAKGSLYSNNEVVTTFETVHEGMGVFNFTPQKGKKYSCKISYENIKNKSFLLPPFLPKGIVLAVDNSATDEVMLKIHSNRDVSLNIASNEVIIIAQSRNTILYASKGELKDKPLELEIPKHIFPSGISQITVFDARLEPVCERLIFIGPEVETSLNKLKLSKLSRNDSSLFTIEVVNSIGNRVEANLSASVSEYLPNEYPNKTSILSSLLLTSDIKGYVRNPWHYLNGTNEAVQHVDLLMLTQGWRRFVWREILSNKFPKITCPSNLGISIGGKITRDFFEIPIPDSKVKLTIKSSYNDVFETKTDSKGYFMFPNLNYEDTIDVQIEAFKPSGGKGVQIVLLDTLVPKTISPISERDLILNYPKDKFKANIKRERLEYKKNFKKREPNNQMFKIHQTPNDVLYVGDDVVNYSNVLSYMQGRVPGVNIIGNKVVIRGVNTFYGSTDPLFLLDGVPIDASSVTMLNPQDIAIIEVLKGPEASIYGSRGGNGVIAFYSRRGEFMKRGRIDFGMLGYHKVREFYAPNYEGWNYKPQNYGVPRTIFWNPEIKTQIKNKTTFGYKTKFESLEKKITIEGITNTGELIYFENLPVSHLETKK